MRLALIGHDLPGRAFCQPDGVLLTNVHVGVQRKKEAVDLFPGDASVARWELEVQLIVVDDGVLDFRGPVVHGVRGERFVYLTWVERHGNLSQMFRRAKLMLSRIDPSIVRDSNRQGMQLTGLIRLTDDRGGPRCARVDPPAIVWSTTTV